MAAAMSSLSSGVNSSCLVITRDFFVRFKKNVVSDSTQLKYAKYISLVMGILAVLISLIVDKIRGNLLEMSFKTVNLFVGPLFVPFFMALFIPRASIFGTFLGMSASVVASALISFSAEIFGKSVSFLWILPASFLVGISVSIGFTLLRPTKLNI